MEKSNRKTKSEIAGMLLSLPGIGFGVGGSLHNYHNSARDIDSPYFFSSVCLLYPHIAHRMARLHSVELSGFALIYLAVVTSPSRFDYKSTSVRTA